MKNSIQSIRGVTDILPEQTPIWLWLESVIKQVTHSYGYQQIRLPIIEPLALFERAVGESTDIVSKEMYNFVDKSGEHITLRPEGTSSCARAVIEHNMCYNTTQRLWYQGPMFRYERPQKGRLRQFTQFGVETFGMAGPDIDAELICMAYDIFKALGVHQHIYLEINSLGTASERQTHRQQLIHYFKQHANQLDQDSLNRLNNNPLRILDSKNPAMQEMINQAPKLIDFIGEESLSHFNKLQYLLDQADINYTINPRLVRGLDYYSKTVFEWITDKLGSQATVCGGGRYDGLIELFSKKELPGSGFAIGIERLLLLIETLGLDDGINNAPDITITCESPQQNAKALLIANNIRHQLPKLQVLTDLSSNKIKRQHSRALKTDSKLIITLNDNDSVGLWYPKNNESLTVTSDLIIITISEYLNLLK
ncbi:histidine--tRNA ligase [Photobacterium angustum]|uniref:histidine--tRNA ligase n=1 Tax=Photobacterium angustum TaxID=661 RepID=UPI0005E38438|nr:histidine--tRNA ligase [Photobacterium angustum]KJG27748.1 histidine--tRNA ligase [Photobacterium angustum]PSW87754.1 histidine--tRNA ligase [Photobacterium angustum]